MKRSASIQARKPQFASSRARFLIGIVGAVVVSFTLADIAQAAVSIDQQPLVVAQPVAPNIVLMLDDSGSMGSDYMPDSGYMLGSTDGSDSPTADDYRAYNTNGTYYNPSVSYTPPVKADGTPYTNAGFPNAWDDGFVPSNGTDNIPNYSSWGGYPYYTTVTVSPSSNSCPAGTTAVYQNNNLTGCTVNMFTYNSGTFSRNNNGSITRSYTANYVAQNCYGIGNCDSSASAQQNVANWFSFYRTRMLMAKSGLMNAFASLNPSYRFGYGSIDGGAFSAGDGMAGTTAFQTHVTVYTRRGSYLQDYDTGVTNVYPFGSAADVSAGSDTQRADFWNWIVAIQPTGYTPLRGALDGVGQYYAGTLTGMADPLQAWKNTNVVVNSNGTTSVTTLSNSPYACRQSYTILTTDGFWNGNDPTGIGDADYTSGPTVTGPNSKTNTYDPIAPYAQDSASSVEPTLADVAMYYWKNDLQSGIPNEVPTSTEDPAWWQHMTTFTVGLGFSPTGISPAGTTIDQIFSWANGGAAISNFSWPTPSSNSINNIADLAHAAVNGHGGFYSAKNPQDFASGIADALKRASERVGTGASLAANSTKLSTGTVTYQANYYTGKWKGDLKAYAVDPNTGAIAATPTWSAVTALPTAPNRNIWTYNPNGNNANSQFIAFKSSSTLSNDEYTALGGSTTPSDSTNMINYLRGDATYEIKNNGTYRNRDTPLGDIVNSQPVYVGAPDPNLFSGQSFTGYSDYATFAANESTRSGQIYVAANDGMLHAFDAATGAETFAYLPAAVITNGLSTLSNKDYGTTTAVPHQFFNDGEVTVSDIYVSSGTGKGWHTILVGTTGRGTAKTVYALDVTDPTSIQFLWERSAGDGKTNSNYIGQMSGKPVIAQTADKQWQVLMGNGYNSTSDRAALLEFALTTSSGAWDTTGTLTAITAIPLGSTASNGLAAPVTWIGDPTNGVSTVAYAGDLLGDVWSFDLASHTSTMLFTATDAGGKAQPITAGMLAGKDPATGNVWLFFGTGKYLDAADLADMSTQSWYGIIVQSGPTQLASLVTNLSSGRSALVNRSIIAEVPPTAGDPTATPPVLPTLGLRAFTIKPTTDDMTGKSGWYIDLTSPVNGAEGERMVTPNQFQGSLLIGTSRIPQAADVCNPTGRGWIMALDPFTGTNPASNFFDTNGDGKFDAADMVTLSDGTQVPAGGVGFSSLPNNPIFVGNTMLVSFDDGSTSSIATAGSVGSLSRTSWREIVNQ